MRETSQVDYSFAERDDNREDENTKKNLFILLDERTLRLRWNDSNWRVEGSRERI